MKESYIKQLIKILQDSEIDSLEISSFWGKSNIKLSKNSGIKSNPISTATSYIDPNISSQKIEQTPIIKKIDESKDEIEDLNTKPIEQKTEKSGKIEFITAPLVGTYYSSPKPEDPPFVSVGDRVEVGQTICIIEAMKIFNDIDCEISGVIEEVLIENGNPVEYGQKIISIRIDD